MLRLGKETLIFAALASTASSRYDRFSQQHHHKILILLLKFQSESVSSTKVLVLYHVGSAKFETSGVREKLGVNPKTKSVTIKPAQVPAGYELYVQSTSPNRKVPEGYVLLEGDAAAAPTPAPAGRSSTKPPPAKKRKRNEDEDDNDEDDDGDDGGGGDEDDELVLWEAFDGLNDDHGDLDEEELVKRDGKHEYCDEAVPESVLESSYNKILNVLKTVNDWKELQRIKFPKSAYKQQWMSRSHHMRLLYFTADDLQVIVLEQKGKFGAVVGIYGGHPFIQTSEFGYGNSDGSAFSTPIKGNITPDRVLVNMLNDLWYHGHDSVH